MCLGENSANHAVHYLNAQLGALWENSVQCAKRAGNGLKPLDRVRYDFALAEYHIGSKQRSKFTMKDDMMFSAIFGRPRLEFICNHEAVLYLKIKEGHFNRDYAKMDLSAFVPNRSRNVQLHDMEVAFRLGFGVSGIRGHTSTIGNGSHIIQLLVLNLNSAKLVSKVNVAGGRDALSSYLKKYLEFLHHAGHHVLFSLPDFDDDRLDIIIDYSLESHNIRNLDTEVEEVFGISTEEINRQISSKWLKSIMDADDGADRNAICLAEYNSAWTNVRGQSNIRFHVKFGAPRIKALCAREAVLYFQIDEILVYEGDNSNVPPKHKYTDWEIAVVVDLLKEAEGTVNRVKLDMTTVRFCDQFSKFSGLDLSSEFAVTLKATFVEFIDEYSTALERAHFHVIHVIDTSHGSLELSGSGDTDAETEPWGTVETTGHSDHHKQVELVKKTNMSGFDFIQFISQQSILEHFKTLWQQSRDATAEYSRCLGKWAYGEDFKATFGAFKICILSDAKAIIWVQLDEGTLKPLKSSKTYDFIDWSVAFEVRFKLVDHNEVSSTSKSWVSRFTDSFAWKQHGNKEDRTFKHLCLDFNTAEFVYDLSKFEGLHLGNRSAVESVKGTVHYLKEHYFQVLTLHGHQILHSVPLWKSGSSPPPLGLTSLTFQIYSKHHYGRHNCHHSDAALVLLGATKFRPLPAAPLEYSADWIAKYKKQLSHGTITLSKKLFLDERLLALLSCVNATTTLIPIFPSNGEVSDYVSIFIGQQEGEWGLALTTWARRYFKKSRSSRWELNSGSDSDYKWDHTDKWSYEHEGALDDKHNGVYTVACRTKNYLTLPKSFNRGSLDIVMRGEIDISLGFAGGASQWTSKAFSKWAVTLSLTSQPGGSGMSIDVKGDTKPKFDVFRVKGDASLEKLVDLNALHSLVEIDLEELVSELKKSFGGVWEHCFPGMQAYSLCNPVFNSHGDILFELRSWVPRTELPVTVTKSRPGNSTKTSVPPIIIDSGVEHPAPPKKSKSFLRRIGDGIIHAGHTVGEVIEDAFDGSPSDDDKEKPKKAATSSPTPITPLSENNMLKTPSTAVNNPKVKIVDGSEKLPTAVSPSPSPVVKAVTPPMANGNGVGPPKPMEIPAKAKDF